MYRVGSRRVCSSRPSPIATPRRYEGQERRGPGRAVRPPSAEGGWPVNVAIDLPTRAGRLILVLLVALPLAACGPWGPGATAPGQPAGPIAGEPAPLTLLFS